MEGSGVVYWVAGGGHKVLILWEEICAGKTGSQTVRRER